MVKDIINDSKILDGKSTARSIKQELEGRIPKLALKGVVPGLAVILIGDDPASQVYVNSKQKACKRIGIVSVTERRPESIGESELLELIDHYNHQPEFHGILGWLEFFISDLTQRHVERKIKNILKKSGLFDPEIINIEDIVRFSKHIIPTTLKGEPGLIAGITMRDALTRYAGVVNIGPFGCMPVRFTESVLMPITDARAKLESYRDYRRSVGLLPTGD